MSDAELKIPVSVSWQARGFLSITLVNDGHDNGSP